MVMISKNSDELPGGHGLGKCCLCPGAIMLDESSVIIYVPNNKLPAHLTVRAHLSCFQMHPMQYLNLMKRHVGIVVSEST